tara:strand:+ start:3760 stop:4635 length:876 start_codon:yes stop_codon:yes gene_type:complete
MIKKGFFFILIIIATYACNWSDYEGYSKTISGLHYQLNYIGDGGNSPVDDDFIQYNLIVTTLNDSILYTNNNSLTGGLQWEAFHLGSQGGINEGISMMQVGDSVTFIINLESLSFEGSKAVPFVPASQIKVKAQIKLLKLHSSEEHKSFLTKQTWKEDDEMNEIIVLNEFLELQNIGNESLKDGIYFIEHEIGKGAYPENGKVLYVHYKAGFTDGTFLDDTYFIGHPLEVRLGDPGQMLPGFEVGVRRMRVGGHATFIIPSIKGFAERGSSSGLVKPFQTLIYEVELVGVK